MKIQSFFIFCVPILSLTSCSWSFTDQPKDFTWFYTKHIHSQVAMLRDFWEDIGYFRSFQSTGKMIVSGMVPEILSGSLNTEYQLGIDGRDTQLDLSKIVASYTSLIGSESISLDELSIVSKGGDIFFRQSWWDQLQGFLPPELSQIFAKYNKKWISITAEDTFASLTGATEQERMQFQVSQMLSQLTLGEIESYLIQYPIWKETKDLGMSGALHQYSVELHRENIIALIEDFTKKATGQSLSEDAKWALRADLDSLSLVGTLAFDPTESRVFVFDWRLSELPDTQQGMAIRFSQEPNTFSLSSEADEVALKIDGYRTTDSQSMNASLTQSGMEVAKWNLITQKEGKRISRIDSTIAWEWLTATFSHEVNKNGWFSGSLNFGVGNLLWAGQIDDQILTSIKLQWAMIGNSLSLNLNTATDDLLTGPLLIQNGNDTIFYWDVGLRATSDRFSFSLDAKNAAQSTWSLGSIFFDLTSHKSLLNSSIDKPSWAIPVHSILSEMQLENKDSWSSDVSIENTSIQ